MRDSFNVAALYGSTQGIRAKLQTKHHQHVSANEAAAGYVCGPVRYPKFGSRTARSIDERSLGSRVCITVVGSCSPDGG